MRNEANKRREGIIASIMAEQMDKSIAEDIVYKKTSAEIEAA